MMIQESLAEEISQYPSSNQCILQSFFGLTMDEIKRDRCKAQLFKDCIIITIQYNGSTTLLKVNMNFDLIFELLRQEQETSKGRKKKTGPAHGIRFQRFQHSLELSSLDNNQEQLFTWRDQLKGKLNQRGFHELFKPIKKIGKGNFASVYLVTKYEDGKKYAVKAFSKEGAYSEQKGKESLINEIQIMRGLDHPNLMKLYQVYQSNNSVYVVVELLEGGQLYDKVKAKYSFAKKEVLTVMRSLLEGLQAMHSVNIMHRDLKPENVIFKNQGQFDCVVADFGLSTYVDSKQYLFVRCGTPGYVAPEVVNLKDLKAKYDPVCDMFSMGVIFHILTMKKSPFPGKQYNEVLSQNRACNIDFSKQQYKKIPESWLNLMRKMLQKNPKKRISASEALQHQAFKDSGSEKVRKDSVCIGSKEAISQDRKPLHRVESPQRNTSMVCDSPIMTTKNNERKNSAHLREDSCLKFKMKENIYAGKVSESDENIEQINSPLIANKKNNKQANESRFKRMNAN